MSIPEPLAQVAAQVHAGRSKRAKVRTLMGWYGLKRRREAGIAIIRSHLQQLGLETQPDFETAGFDDQVHFVTAGGKITPPENEEPDGDTKTFQIDEEPDASGQARFRILLKTYDSYERLRSRLVGERLAAVYFSGQNARREDRDRYPFVILVGLAADYSVDDLESWAEEACALEPVETEEPDESEPETPAPAPDIRAHLADLASSLRASVTAEVERVREAVERKVEEIRFESVRELAKELNDAEALRIVEEFENEYRARLEQANETIRQLSEQLQLAQARIDDLTAAEDEPSPDDAYPTMVATVRLFADLCRGSHTTVAESAEKSAERSSCTRRREVLLLLLTIRDLGEALYNRGGLGQPIADWFLERGYEYAVRDSQTTSTRFGEQRTIWLDGRPVQMSEHVTLFPNTSQCVSVYWWRDDQNRRLVVGYVGPHLRTVSR